LPFCQVILSVSGSAARKKIFFCLAKSVTARPMWERKVPVISTAPSRETSSSATRTASPGLPLSSREITCSFLPSTPPAALTSSTASSQPFL
jgi:hypothetical protein